MRHEQVVGLDLLRFFAACFVMMYHLGFWYLILADTYPLTTLHISQISQYTSSATKYGFVGVEIFFVISGYVVSFSIEGRTRSQYLRARFLRLWPTVWVCATVCLILAIATRQGPIWMLVSPYIRSIVIFPKGPWIDGVYWTLPIEIAFYIFMLFVVGGDRVNQRAALALALGTASIGFWVCYLTTHSIPQFEQFTHIFDRIASSQACDVFLIHHGIYFALGILMHSPASKKVMIFFCSSAIFFAFIEISEVSDVLNQRPHVHISPWPAYALWLVCVAYLVAAVRYNSAVINALGQKRVTFFRGVGLLTYPLYLMHTIVAFATAFFLLRLGAPQVVAWSAGPLMAIISAMVIAQWIEPRARRLTASAIDHLVRQVAVISRPDAHS
jgi:peptidoglycan/LPS O-acetylase OafA/YrhL